MEVIEVTISNAGGTRVPSVSRIPLESDVSVAFKTAEDSETTLYLTEQVKGILSPTPESLDIKMGAGEVRTLSFRSAKPGRYCIVLQSPQFPRPNNIGCGQSDPAAVFLIPGDGSDYPVGPDDPQQIIDPGTLL